ncbi:MAG TPA: hypothetical protein VGZ02_08865 [Candidatus Baltobacteraceae bacterium]|nr:hypothetical protein [Candidatus Baltobacteraceae bacterium]
MPRKPPGSGRKALLKYLLIATVLVVVAVSIVAAYANRQQLALKIKSVYVPVTPKPVTPFAEGARRNGAFTGEGTWALSALPECFTQISRTTGPLSYVLEHLPRGAVRVSPGTTLAAADCRVFVHNGSVWVWRGMDRLRVPPPARLYQAPGSGGVRTLALLQGWRSASDLRIYAMAQAQRP